MVVVGIVVVMVGRGGGVSECSSSGGGGDGGGEGFRKRWTHARMWELLYHGCMIPLLAIKISARCAACPDFLVRIFAPIRLYRVGLHHRDVDADQSR